MYPSETRHINADQTSEEIHRASNNGNDNTGTDGGDDKDKEFAHRSCDPPKYSSSSKRQLVLVGDKLTGQEAPRDSELSMSYIHSYRSLNLSKTSCLNKTGSYI